MKMKSSYIFLRHPYKEFKKKDEEGNIIIGAPRSVGAYLKRVAPYISKDEEGSNIYTNKYKGCIEEGDSKYEIEFVVITVLEITYVDIIVQGKRKKQIINYLEKLQKSILDSGIRKEYVEIISYDAISEYYCNKIYPKLNSLERNLRELLFNIYVLNFGEDYYKITMDIDLQGKIKRLINSNSTKEQRSMIRTAYEVTGDQAESIDRLQNFFYSLEFGDVQTFLFKETWTSEEKEKRDRFLSENTDLSVLSDLELREAFDSFTPKSDWERFFSSKINIADVEAILKEIRGYRNLVAHCKFFNKEDYEKCNKQMRNLNKALIEATQITKEKDFSEKNAERLGELVFYVKEVIGCMTRDLAKSFQVLKDALAESMLGITKMLQDYRAVIPKMSLNFDAAIAKESLKMQEIYNELNPSTIFRNELTSLYGFAQGTTPIISMPNIDFTKPKIDFNSYLTNWENSIPQIPIANDIVNDIIADDEDATDNNEEYEV